MLHFAQPQAYHDIYNNKNRWDKEWHLYHSFNEDRSSFGFITYNEAKERKDVLNKSFSPKAIEQIEGIITDKIDALSAAFTRCTKTSAPVDLFFAYRCLTMDIITFLCFGTSINAIDEPDFRAPITEAMEASLPVFIRFKHSDLYKNMILGCPAEISKIISPATRGLVELQQLLQRQIKEVTNDPKKLEKLPHAMTIYHRLLDNEAYANKTVPLPGSLYEEAQAMMFAGTDTVANTLMLGSFHLLRQRERYDRLKRELEGIWSDLKSPPDLKRLESLRYLNAIIKESLRLSSGVISGLPRVVPSDGANICGIPVPGETVVSCGSTFVHYNANIFPEPQAFYPERWLEKPELDTWLVAFSKGPRMCLGINTGFTNNVVPAWGRGIQWAKETTGQADDKTELPSDYLALEKRVDALQAVHKKMLQVTSQYTHESYDYPPNLRESFNDLGRTISEKVNLLSNATSPQEAQAALTAPPQAKPQPKTFSHALARAALSSSQSLARVDAASSPSGMIPEEPLAQALENYAIAEEKVGEARLAQDAAIQSRFLAGWSTTLNTNLMFAKRARTGVENARLHLDATKAKAKGGPGFNLGGTTGQGQQHGAGEEEMSEEAREKVEKAEDDFVAQTEEAVGVMKNVLDTPEPLRNLADLIAAQLEYHKRAYEILSELAPTVDQLQVEQEANYRKAREGA
ncbi:MAG: hypothetical protein Q9165_002570 [Trypethelium subeluteriae]